MSDDTDNEIGTIQWGDIQAFKRHAEALKRLMKRINKYAPGAHLYAANDNLCLMGHQMDMRRGPDQDDIVESLSIPGLGGGDW